MVWFPRAGWPRESQSHPEKIAKWEGGLHDYLQHAQHHRMRILKRRMDQFLPKRHAFQILTVDNPHVGFKVDNTVALWPHNTFFKKNAITIHPHNDDPMVISVRYAKWEIKRVLIDQGSLQTSYTGM